MSTRDMKIEKYFIHRKMGNSISCVNANRMSQTSHEYQVDVITAKIYHYQPMLNKAVELRRSEHSVKFQLSTLLLYFLLLNNLYGM
jgi:hypothetical protein